jgi:hypothetical protein
MGPLNLNPAVLRDLQSLNFRYLELLARAGLGAAPDTDRVLGLPVAVARRLGALDGQQRLDIAACACALFSLDWDALLAMPLGIADTPAFAHTVGERRGRALCAAVAVYAGQLARSDALSARIVLGLSDNTIPRLTGLTVGRLLDNLRVSGSRLQTRFTTNEHLWPDLVRFARRRDVDRLELARWRAVQLSLAEAAGGSA